MREFDDRHSCGAAAGERRGGVAHCDAVPRGAAQLAQAGGWRSERVG